MVSTCVLVLMIAVTTIVADPLRPIQRGDILEIHVWNAPEFNTSTPIAFSDKFPFAGATFSIVGLTPRDAELLLQATLEPRLERPNVTVTVRHSEKLPVCFQGKLDPSDNFRSSHAMKVGPSPSVQEMQDAVRKSVFRLRSPLLALGDVPTFMTNGPLTILEALERLGQIQPDANLADITIRRGNLPPIHVNYLELQQGRHLNDNVPLQANDTVIVP